MATANIAYEVTTGRILMLHHFAAEAGDPELTRRDAMQLAELSEDQVAVISVPADEVVATRLHRIDLDRKALVEAEAGEKGVGFAVVGTRPEGGGGSPYTPETA